MKKPLPFNAWRIAIVAAACTVPIGLPISVGAASTLPMIELYAEQLKTQGTDFSGFSAERGKVFFNSTSTTGKPEMPSCTSCHTKSPLKVGQTRAGKTIEPMAVSRTPERYTDPKKVKKWFRRNCKSVLGRECTPLEKGDFLTFMLTQ